MPDLNLEIIQNTTLGDCIRGQCVEFEMLNKKLYAVFILVICHKNKSSSFNEHSISSIIQGFTCTGK